MLKFFRITSLLEGSSYLLILCVSLGIISREFVQVIGMGHGVLFMLYLVFLLLSSYKQRWSVLVGVLMFLAAIIPFAFLFVEAFLQKALKKERQKDLLKNEVTA